jgi:peptidoglycan/xylan/chitin deacetylase (PgdA/CDA1 family)
MNSIITFHNIDNCFWFERVILFLKSRYQFVPLEALYDLNSASDRPPHSCHISVDDGDRSFYDLILPVLLKHRVPASLFVSPKMCVTQSNFWFQEIEGYNQQQLKQLSADRLNLPLKALSKFSVSSILKGMPVRVIEKIVEQYQEMTSTCKKEFRNLSVEALRVIDKTGLVTIGAHTMTHPILKNEDDFSSEREIYDSVRELSTLLGHEISYFAYPNGIPALDFTEREVGYLRHIGIRLALTSESRHLASSDDLMKVPRIQISCNESIVSIRAKLILGSKWNSLKKLKLAGEYTERIQLMQIIRNKN